MVPARGWIRVGPPPGLERLIFVASPRRLPSIDVLVGTNTIDPGDLQRTIAAINNRRQPDYRFERVREGNGLIFRCFTAEAKPALVAEITLNHTR